MRQFRNTDPPRLRRLWNDTLLGRGAYPLASEDDLERWLFAKPYFDPAGLLLVGAGPDDLAGAALCGFGPNVSRDGLDTGDGVIALLLTSPRHRKRGVGAALLAAAEHYLKERGARHAWAGAMRPHNPFGFGLYGGSHSPGLLDGDRQGVDFLLAAGYAPAETCAVYQRRLDVAPMIVDSRFGALRKRFEFRAQLKARPGSWWDEALTAPVEPYEAQLLQRDGGAVAAQACYWAMDGYSARWGCAGAGLYDVEVRPDLRRLGLSKFLFAHLLRHLHEQYFGLAELQVRGDHAPGRAMALSVGLREIDRGTAYRKDFPPPAATTSPAAAADAAGAE